MVGDPYGDRSSVLTYLNRDAVVIPTDLSQPFGNAPRNSVRGPGFWQLDVVAGKEFPLPVGDQTRIQIRIEAFNVLNRTNFRGPIGNRSNAAFGTITVHLRRAPAATGRQGDLLADCRWQGLALQARAARS